MFRQAFTRASVRDPSGDESFAHPDFLRRHGSFLGQEDVGGVHVLAVLVLLASALRCIPATPREKES